jgi:hypothetical protein
MELSTHALGALAPRRSALSEADLRTTWPPLIDPLFARPWTWYGADELVRAGDAALARCAGDLARLPSRAEGWRPDVTTDGTGGFTDLLDLDAVEDLVATRRLAPPFLQLVRELPTGADVSSVGRFPTGPGRSVDAIADGALVVINDAQELWQPLHAFCARLAVGLGEGATADVHLALGPGPSLVDHMALDDAFVLQVVGASRWRVDGWTLARDRATTEGPDGLVGARAGLDARLGTGQSLLVPEGFTCSGRTGSGPSLSVLVWVDGRPAGSRAPSAPGERFWVGDGVPCRSTFGRSGDRITTEAVLARRPGVVVWARELDERLVLRTDRCELVAPAWVAGWVHHLLSGPATSMAALVPSADLPDARVLVERLVRDGFLALV